MSQKDTDLFLNRGSIQRTRNGRRLLLALDGGLHAQQHEADGEADEGDGEAGDGSLRNLGANRREFREGKRGRGGGRGAAGAGDELGGAAGDKWREGRETGIVSIGVVFRCLMELMANLINPAIRVRRKRGDR